jgi:S1-C subfamily serine protease
MRTKVRRTAARAAWLGALGVLLLAPSARSQGALSALQTDVGQIVDRARPCVVTVFAQLTVVHRDSIPGQPARRAFTRVGSGVAVEESAVLTTASVVLGAERIVVRTVNGLQVEAQLAGMDPIFNVALLRVPRLSLPTLSFAARPAQVGDWVIALGTSYGAQPTQSVGTIAYRYREPRSSLLQLTNAVYPGNSGGAALNTLGQLVGIVQGELGSPDFSSSGPDAERRPSGMSFVLPIEEVRPVYELLQRAGRVPHGFLGVSTRAEVVQSESDATRVPLGAMIEAVKAGGPAARLGLRRGDLIVAFERERVEYPEQLARWVAETRPGTPVGLVWVHDGIERRGHVPLGESPQDLPEWLLSPTASDSAPDDARISELERQIQQLSRELQRLKGHTR